MVVEGIEFDCFGFDVFVFWMFFVVVVGRDEEVFEVFSWFVDYGVVCIEDGEIVWVVFFVLCVFVVFFVGGCKVVVIDLCYGVGFVLFY